MHASTELPADLRGRVLIAGAGVSGAAASRLLAQLGADVTVADDNVQAREKLTAAVEGAARPVAAIGVAEAQDMAGDWDFVVTSPGWRPDSPLLLACREAGAEVVGDVELAYRLDKAGVFGAPRTWLAVTGTNGKTTTTGMLAQIMAADAPRSGRRAQAVGNIGTSPFEALRAEPRVDVLVAELSSFQLHWSSQLRPHVGALLNLAEDHLDWHGGFEEYAAAKAKVLCGEVAVVGRQDLKVGDWEDALRNSGELATRVYGFVAGEPRSGEVGVVDGRLVARDVATPGAVDLAAATGLQPAGVAGVLDAAAAAAVALAAGAAPASIAQGLSGYTVDGHRGAVVHRRGGVDFVDNSKATNPHAAAAAMEGVDSIVWVAGGQLKGASVEDLVAAHSRQLKAVVVLGIDRAEVARSVHRQAPHAAVVTIDDTDPQAAMEKAVSAAAQHAEDGDTVLLAPAAASLDMYTGMAQRGDFFAAAARGLDEGSGVSE